MPTLGAKVGPKVAPREPKGPKRSPKALPGAAKNHKQIDLGHHLGTQGGPGGSRGTPGRENSTKINQKNDNFQYRFFEKGKHFVLFS